MAMKESGIEWVGLIPDNWKIAKNNRLFNISKQLVNENWKNTQLLSLTKSGIIEKNINDGGGKQPESFGTYQYVEKDDIVLCLFDIDVSAVFSDRSKYDGMISPAYRVMKCTDAILPVYAKWWFDAVNIGRYYLIYTKSLRKTIDADGFGNILTVVPPLSEQQAIADYLDETCSKIDEIIAEAKASIDEYKELKQSVIFEAVTKGLDKNVEMKDSGYDFIGDIPSKWEMCKVRHLGTAQNGISIGGDAFGSGYSFVSYGDVYKNYSLPKTVDKLVRSSEEDRKRYSVEKGDWFFTRTSETIEEVGFSCVCEETIPDAVFAGFLIRVRPFNNRIYTRFAKYYFRSNHLRTFFVKEMNLVTRASLAQGLLKDAPVVVPPYDEQIEIANYLENKCTIIDGVIKDKESTINDLEAYKKSLIYEVVTGKRRVV